MPTKPSGCPCCSRRRSAPPLRAAIGIYGQAARPAALLADVDPRTLDWHRGVVVTALTPALSCRFSAERAVCRTRLPVQIERGRRVSRRAQRQSGGSASEAAALPCGAFTRMQGHSGLELCHLRFPTEVSGISSLADLPHCAGIPRCCGAGMQPRSLRHRGRSILAADEVKESLPHVAALSTDICHPHTTDQPRGA